MYYYELRDTVSGRYGFKYVATTLPPSQAYYGLYGHDSIRVWQQHDETNMISLLKDESGKQVPGVKLSKEDMTDFIIVKLSSTLVK